MNEQGELTFDKSRIECPFSNATIILVGESHREERVGSISNR
jgi:hypothetical protein